MKRIGRVISTLFLSLIIIMVITSCNGSKKIPQWASKFQSAFENAEFIPNLEEIMPQSVTDNVNLTGMTSNNKNVKMVNCSVFSLETTAYMETSEFEGIGFINNEFNMFVTTFVSAKERAQMHKDMLVGTVFSDDFGIGLELGVWSGQESDMFRMMYKELDDKIEGYTYVLHQNGTVESTKTIVYNNNDTETFMELIEGNITSRQYYSLKEGLDFVFIESLTSNNETQIRGMVMNNTNDIFEGVVFSIIDGVEYPNMNNRILYMSGNENEYLQYEHIGFGLDDDYYRMLIIKDGYGLLGNGMFNFPDKYTISIALNAFEDVEGIYYNKQNNDYLGMGFRADGIDFSNTYAGSDGNPAYGLQAGISTYYTSGEVDKSYTAWLTLSGEFNPNNLGEYFPQQVGFKENVNFNFIVNKEKAEDIISNYKLTQINVVSDLIIVDDYQDVVRIIYEYLEEMGVRP